MYSPFIYFHYIIRIQKTQDNKFRLVIATAKRARQIASGSEKLTDVEEEAPVTIAANEIAEGKVIIKK